MSIFSKKVELHCHLDGSIRHSTVWDILREKCLPLPGNGTYEDLIKALVITEPKDLNHFLAPYEIFTPIFQGDTKVAERIAYEYCEDAAKQGITYAEVRYSPHKLAGPELYKLHGEKGLEHMVEATTKGLIKGSEKFGINLRTILIVYQGWPGVENIGEEVLRLCHKYDDVVGLDVCVRQPPGGGLDEAPITPQLTKVFDEAKKTGVHTTLHAGEASGPNAIDRAKNYYKSDRIGHGYHVVKDPKLYADCLNDNVHFECCPYSSFLTGAVPLKTDRHPIARFAHDGANISLNSDDPTLTGKSLNEDYILARSWGLTNEQIFNANLNAAKASFLPEHEKSKLVNEIRHTYGLQD